MRWLHTITLILEKSSYNPHYSSMHFHFFSLLYKKSNVLSLFFIHTRIYHKLNWNYLLTIFDEYTFNFNYSNRNTFFKNKINRFIIIRKICIKKVSPITNRIHDFSFFLSLYEPTYKLIYYWFVEILISIASKNIARYKMVLRCCYVRGCITR